MLLLFVFLFNFSSNTFSYNFFSSDSCNLSLVESQSLTCFQGNDGLIAVQADTGSGFYHYYLQVYNPNIWPLNGGWQPLGQFPIGSGYTSIDSIGFGSLPADTFRIVLVDDVGCTDTVGFPSPLIITQPSQINIVENVQSSTNILSNDGSISLLVSGGNSPYSISWFGPNGFVDSVFSMVNLLSGIYSYTFSDSNECEIIDSVYVDALQDCSYGSFNSVPTVCYGESNGQIIIDSVFGSPQFTYSLEIQDPTLLVWNPVSTITISDTSYVFSGLPSGVYRYTVIDNNGCQVTTPSISVDDPTQISHNNTIISASSNLICDGQIFSVTLGGVAPFSHFWSGPNGYFSTNANIDSLCSGVYYDSIVDNIGCSQIISFVVGVDPDCDLEIEVNNIFCDLDSSGYAIATKTNNEYPLFVWRNILGDTVSMDTIASNLPVGIYSFEAYSLGLPNACPDTSFTFSVLETEISLVSLNGNVICPDDSTLFIVDPVNVDSSFLYQIVLGFDSFYLGDSSMYYPVGLYSYIVEVDTGSGFLSCFDVQEIEVVANDLNIDSLYVEHEVCANSFGSINIFATSNYLPLIYSLGVVNQSFSYFDSLESSYYSIDVIDQMGCIVNRDSIFVGIESLLSLQLDSSLETCREGDGWIEIVVSNGNPGYQYSIDGGSTYSSSIFSDTLLIDSLVSSNYDLILRDDSSCIYDYGQIFLGKTDPVKIDSVFTINESCCGLDGQIIVYADDPGAVVKYSIDTLYSSQDSSQFDSLFRGDYLIHIEDINDCIDSVEVHLSVDSTPSINMAIGITDIVCYGDTNGTLKVYYPDDCYDYSLWRYTLFNPQVIIDTGVYFNELIVGFYGVIATSNSGTCIDSSGVRYISQPDSIFVPSTDVSNVKCIIDDSCNGQLFIPFSPAGGVSPYFYYVKDFINNIPFGMYSIEDTFTSLCPGYYEVQVVDGNACVVYDTVLIQDSSLYIDSFNVQSISCYTGNDGVIEVFASGGIPPYNYTWSNLDTLSWSDNLTKGWYSVSVTDSFACFVSDSAYITHPDTLQFKILENGKKPESCMGVSYDGEIYLQITGGTPPYNYMWSSYSGNNSGYGFGDTMINLTYDTIIIDVTDANYCSASPSWGTVNIAVVDALNSENPLFIDSIYSLDDPICYNSYSGFIYIEIDGGDLPIYYSIDSAQTYHMIDSFTQLQSGRYPVYVIDAYGCLDSAIVNINQYEEILISYDNVNHVSCYLGRDGQIDVSVLGGVPPYSYLWIPTFDTLSSISGLESGPHVLRVSDDAACVLVDTIILDHLTSPMQTQSFVLREVTCHQGDNGVATTDVFGGMPPYQYVWTNIFGDTVSLSHDADSLYAGLHVVLIQDSFKCGPISDTILMKQSPMIDFEVIDIRHNVCSGDSLGSIALNIDGGFDPYLVYIMDYNSNISFFSGLFIDNLASSDYTIWIIDDSMCFSDTLVDVKLGEPGKINLSAQVDSLSCFNSGDGMISLGLLGGTSPYYYIVESENDIISQGVSNQFTDILVSNLHSGDYYVHVSDFNECFTDSVFFVLEPDEIIADFVADYNYGSRPFEVSFKNQSVGGNIYSWDFDNNYTIISSEIEVKTIFQDQGTYEVMMIAYDSNLSVDCSDTAYTFIESEGYDVYNVFSPNNDGVNDFFHFNEYLMYDIQVYIFNRWGQPVFEWSGVDFKWSGQGYNGSYLDEGVYFYRMEGMGFDGSSFEENGTITILK